MKHYSVDYLWVDQECIDQKNEEEKMQAMQAMDKVYSMSDWPLAVLFVPVRTHRELELLADLMRGRFTRQASKRKQGQCDGDLSLDPGLDEVGQYEILDLLYRLTSDPWWSRAWCFQEEHLAGRHMKLLIPHFLGPSAQIDEGIFGKLTTSGDLILSSYEFRTEATMFVLAYVCTAKRKQERFDQGLCRQILTIAGKYTLLAKHGRHLDLDVRGKSMSTLVLSDLGRKHYTLPSDILNIAANCNLYPQVMNTASLDKLGDSLSIATLTMWFLNGEIFRNNDLGGPTNNNTARRVNQSVFQYLHSIAFDDCPPFGEQGRLTYRRKFRFLNPKLTKMGIDTCGHLFGISHIIKLDTDVLEGSETEDVLSLVAKEVRRTHTKLAARLDNHTPGVQRRHIRKSTCHVLVGEEPCIATPREALCWRGKPDQQSGEYKGPNRRRHLCTRWSSHLTTTWVCVCLLAGGLKRHTRIQEPARRGQIRVAQGFCD